MVWARGGGRVSGLLLGSKIMCGRFRELRPRGGDWSQGYGLRCEDLNCNLNIGAKDTGYV